MMEVTLAPLHLGLREINSATIDTHRGTGLHAVGTKTYFAQLLGQAVGSRLGCASTGQRDPADVHKAVEEGTVCQHHMPGKKRRAVGNVHAGQRTVIVKQEVVDSPLPHRQPVGMLENFAPLCRELITVGLRTRTPHSRPLRTIEHTELYRGSVSDDAHHTAQGVNLTHNLPLCDAPHGRVATHLGNLVHVHSHQERPCPQPCGGMCGLTPGVAGTHHYYVEIKSHSQIKL